MTSTDVIYQGNEGLLYQVLVASLGTRSGRGLIAYSCGYLYLSAFRDELQMRVEMLRSSN